MRYLFSAILCMLLLSSPVLADASSEVRELLKVKIDAVVILLLDQTIEKDDRDERILDIIAQAGEEADVDIILDAGTGGVVWARDDVNLTDRIIEDIRVSVQGPAVPQGVE